MFFIKVSLLVAAEAVLQWPSVPQSLTSASRSVRGAEGEGMMPSFSEDLGVESDLAFEDADAASKDGVAGNWQSVLHLSHQVVAKTRDDYVCATIDWWPSNKCNFGVCPWRDRGFLSLNLKSPKIRQAVMLMSPMLIRIGGSLADTIKYDPYGLKDGCVGFRQTKDTSVGFSLHGPCMSGKRWTEILDFCSELGCQIVFDINALNGRNQTGCKLRTDCSKGKEPKCCRTFSGEWDSTNARLLFQFTREWERKQGHALAGKRRPLFGFEFGNELMGTGIVADIPAEEYAKDLHTFASVVREYWPDEAERPKIIGPGATWQDAQAGDFVDFLSLTRGDLDILTYHAYPLGSAGAAAAKVRARHPQSFDYMESMGKKVGQIVKKIAPKAQVWVGEGGGAYNSGRHLVTDAFASSFWYNGHMALLARLGTSAFCRQTLTGGLYGLLDTETLDPNPDFYSAMLWHSFMGPEVLDVDLSSSGAARPGFLRAYAHCSKRGTLPNGSVTLLLLNMDSKKTVYFNNLDGTFGRPTSKRLYLLTAESLESRIVRINGLVLGGLPAKSNHGIDWPGKELKPNQQIALPPFSQAFVVVPQANWKACKT